MNILNNKKGNDPEYLWSGVKTSTLCAAGNFKLYNILFHSVYLFF